MSHTRERPAGAGESVSVSEQAAAGRSQGWLRIVEKRYKQLRRRMEYLKARNDDGALLAVARASGEYPLGYVACQGVKGCVNRAAKHGMCSLHWQRFESHGDPLHIERSSPKHPFGGKK